MNKKWKKGIAFVFTVIMLVLFASFSLTMFEITNSTKKLSAVTSEVRDAELNAKTGVVFFIQKFNQVEFKAKADGQDTVAATDAWLNSLSLPKIFSLGGDTGWFRLDAWEKAGAGANNFKYQLDISGGIYNSTAKASFLNFLDTAYAQSGDMLVQFRVILTSSSVDGSSLGYTSEDVPNVKGTHINAYSYPDPGVFNSPSLGSPNAITLDGTVTANTTTGDISANMAHILEQLNLVESNMKTLIDGATKPNTDAPSDTTTVSISAGSFNFTLAGTQTTEGHKKAHCGGSHSSSSATYYEAHYCPQNSLTYTGNAIIGGPGTFSYMKFKDVTFSGNNTKMILYPGIYEFHTLYITGNNKTIYLDTTTGPVYIITRGNNSEFKMAGNNNAMMVFKDNTYTGNDVMGNPVVGGDANYFTGTNGYANKVDLANKYNETFGPGGRKVAYIVNVDPYGLDKEAWISGNNNFIAGIAVGGGGNNVPSLPISVDTTKGSEMAGDPNNTNPGWTLFNTTNPTTDHFRIFSTQYGEIRFLGDNNTMLGIFYGTDCSYHATEFEIKGNNNVVYGAISHKGKVSLDGNNIDLKFDSRITPFPPKPTPGTRHAEYIVRVK